jgi:hypothetical protein
MFPSNIESDRFPLSVNISSLVCYASNILLTSFSEPTKVDF